MIVCYFKNKQTTIFSFLCEPLRSLRLCVQFVVVMYCQIATKLIAQDIYPGRKISWDIRPTRTYVRLHFPSGMNMPNDRVRMGRIPRAQCPKVGPARE